jgi:hypothetical protein
MSSSRVSPSTRPVRRRVAMALGACALLASAATARADVLTIDSDSAGTLYDGVIDGFPGLATFDGTADLKGNALAVALLDGVTEERGIVEFPLDALVGLGSGDIVSATLSFNIDDVLSSFGPGTTFDGTAAESIVLFSSGWSSPPRTRARPPPWTTSASAAADPKAPAAPFCPW